ncbi:MAG: hypothetical protein M1281_07740 [Chloroflexi bacterium]|nr:hypothetical protein [Chloroflexota bacterium]
MIDNGNSPYLALLKNRIDLNHIPFTDRGSRLLVMQNGAGLYIRLVERWFKIDQQLAGYRHRPPIVENFNLLDGEGRPLEYTLDTYPHRIDFTTAIGVFSLVFVDIETLLLALPAGACGITFQTHMDVGQTDRRGGVLRVTGNIRRNMAYTTNRPIVENNLIPNADGSLGLRLRLGEGPPAPILLNLTPRLGFNRYLPSVAQSLQEAAQRWHDWFAAVPPVPEAYQRQYYYAWWIMRAGLISTRFYTTREAMTPSKIFYVGIWQWDAYFHALAYRHVDRKLARDQIRVMLDHQLPDGMIPDAVHDEGTVTHLNYPVEADVTKPPLLAWTVWKLYESDRDREFLDEIYEPVTRLTDWWFRENDLDGDGLCEYQHPYSSGLDNNPLWDSGMPVTSPDLNTYLYLQLENLGRIADVLGDKDASRKWQQKAGDLLERMNARLWDSREGLYWAYHNGQPICIRTPFSLFPLLTGKLAPENARRLVDHLTDPAMFWAPYPVPSVARDEATYEPTQMWRGPTWVNVNYLLQEGLDRSGFKKVAQRLRTQTLEMLKRQPDLYEFYDPETGEAGPHAAPVFGWSAALFIELALIEAERQAGQKP